MIIDLSRICNGLSVGFTPFLEVDLLFKMKLPPVSNIIKILIKEISLSLITKGFQMRFVLVILLLVVPMAAYSATIEVPKDYSKIQDAINASASGDTVLVSPGRYIENIDFKGKAITIKSLDGPHTTIIDGKDPMNPDFGSVVTFQNGETLDSILDGFTITNGTGSKIGNNIVGGGVICINSSSPSILNNIITNNSSDSAGGGIFIEGGAPIVANSIISNNEALAD